MAIKKLTPKQEMFCQFYVEHRHGTKAAILAGYAEKSAHVKASQQLAKPEVQNYIEKIQARYQEKLEITPEMILRELWNIANCDVSEAFDEKGHLKNIHDIPEHVRKSIASIETYADFTEGVEVGEVKKVKFWPKHNALNQIGKYLGMFIERVESKTLNVNVDLSEESEAFKKVKKALTGSSDLIDVTPIEIDDANSDKG